MFDLSPDDITDGPLHRALLLLAAPLLVQNYVRVAQQVVDLFWVGRLGDEAVAAVGLASPILWFLLTSAISMPFVGTQVLVSQRVGAEDHRGARRAAFTGLVVAIGLGLGVGALIYFRVETLLDLLTSVRPTSEAGNVPHLATVYLQVLAVGVVFAGMSDVIEAAFLGWGDSRAALYMNVASVAGNLALDPVLILGWGPFPALGMQGAALATVAGYGSGFLLGAAMVLRGRTGPVLARAAAHVDLAEIRELVDIGLPQAVQGAAGTSGTMLLVGIVYTVAGGAGLAAFTVGSRVGSLAFRSVMSLGHAAQSVVGQNLGAGNPGRAHRATWIGVAIGASGLAVIGAGQWLVPGHITHLFVPDIGPRAFDLSVTYLQILAVGYPAQGALSVLTGGLNGARRTKTTMVASLVQTWAIQLPVAAAGGLVLNLGIAAVFWSRPLSLVLVTVGLGAYYVHTTRDGMFHRAAERIDSPAAADS